MCWTISVVYYSEDCSLPGSSVHGILQARVLEWVAISFSRDLPDSGRSSGSLPLAPLGLAKMFIWVFLKRLMQPFGQPTTSGWKRPLLTLRSCHVGYSEKLTSLVEYGDDLKELAPFQSRVHIFYALCHPSNLEVIKDDDYNSDKAPDKSSLAS